MKKIITILASFFVLVFCATTTYARTPDGNKLNTSPFHHIHDSDSDEIEGAHENHDGVNWTNDSNSSEADMDEDADSDQIEDMDTDEDGLVLTDEDKDSDDTADDQIVDTDGDAIDGAFEGHGFHSAADTDGDGINEDEDACPWGDEADGKKCVVVIKFEDLFPF